jgi:hypothetical protein
MNAPRSVVSRPPLVLRFSSFVLQAGAAFFVTLLLLRFGMRALGVRPDVAFPGLIYSLTAPLVQPFYGFFPLPTPYGERFDIAVVETASLAAVGFVTVVILAIFVAGLIFSSLIEHERRSTKM